MKANNPQSNSRKHATTTPIIDSDGHVRETDEKMIGYRSRRDAMLYFPLVPRHG